MRRPQRWFWFGTFLAVVCPIVAAGGADTASKQPNVALPHAGVVCGDGVIELGEACDIGPPLDLDGESCNTLGFPGGTLGCATDCLSFDTDHCLAVPTCGNGSIDPGEVCDGPLLNLQSCSTQGFGTAGGVSCLPDCSGFNTDACVPHAVPPDPCVFDTVVATDDRTFTWPTPADIDMVRGPLRKVRAYKVNQLRRDFGVTQVDVAADNPASGEGFYYLFKHLTTCPPPPFGPSGLPTWASQGQAFDRDDLLPDGGCNRPVPDVWTVNDVSQGFTAINGCTDQVKFSGTLLGAGPTSPRAVAFSTAPGVQGSFALITQGPFLQVVDADNGVVVDKIDVAGLIGRPGICSFSGLSCNSDPQCTGPPDFCQRAVDLRGIATSIPQQFLNPLSTELAFIYIAANVTVSPTDVRPWFIVLDQGSALDGSGGLTSWIQDGDLQISVAGGEAEALDVTVISRPNENDLTEHQRAWFSARDVQSNQIFARLLATPVATLPPNWTVRRSVVTTAQAALPSQFLQIGAGDGGELALKPAGDQGQLIDLERAAPAPVCSLGGTQVAVEIEGPATGSYTAFAVDSQGDAVHIVRETDFDSATCPAAINVPVGQSPTAVDVLGQSFQVKAFVSNLTGNSVTSFNQHGGQAGTTALPAVDVSPVDIAVRQTPSRSCNVEDVQVTGTTVTFNPVGCDADEIFMAWCRCTDTTGVTCPPECPYDPTEDCPTCETVGDNPWEELGVGEGTEVRPVPQGGSVEVEVTAEKREPLP